LFFEREEKIDRGWTKRESEREREREKEGERGYYRRDFYIYTRTVEEGNKTKKSHLQHQRKPKKGQQQQLVMKTTTTEIATK
jgi:hypothetical protein